MEDKKKYKQGPQYDKRPEIKNKKAFRRFKVSKNTVIIALIISNLILTILVFFLIFEPYKETEKKPTNSTTYSDY